MGIDKHKARGREWWRVDAWVKGPDGMCYRVRQKRIPTREMAVELIKKKEREVFERGVLDRQKPMTVSEVWEKYGPVSELRNKTSSYLRNQSLAAHLVKHLGDRLAKGLSQEDVDEYVQKRRREKTRQGKAPASASLNREIALLKRMLGYKTIRKRLGGNPLQDVDFLPEHNTRDVVLTQVDFENLFACADRDLRPIIAVAYNTGLRKTDVLSLKWKQVDLKSEHPHITMPSSHGEVKQKPRTIFLTQQTVDELKKLKESPRSLNGFVFTNRKTGKPWSSIRVKWKKALKAAGLSGVWIHDLRRSFTTNARRRGSPESVVMKMTGHKNRHVFDRYNIVDDDDLLEAVEKLEAGRKIELDKAKASGL